jgi:hypothetical protein
MSRPVITQFATAVLLLITGAVGYWTYHKTSGTPKASPFILQSVFTSKGVTTRVIQIELKYDSVKSHSEEVEIKALVSMPFNYSSTLNYKWKLGEGVSVTEGSVSGEIENLIKGEPRIVVLRVKGFGQESNHHIGFEVSGNRSDQVLYGDALIASDLENTFENTVQNVERLKANQ